MRSRGAAKSIMRTRDLAKTKEEQPSRHLEVAHDVFEVQVLVRMVADELLGARPPPYH